MIPPPPLIVAVDDEPDDIFFLRRTIGKTGLEHRFQPYSNGGAATVALGAIANGSPGAELPIVCFLDIKMVGMSGFELLKWIRSQRGLDLLPVVMFSSSDHPSDVDTARELGAQGYLKKYPSVTAMQTVLTEAMEFAISPSGPKTFLHWTYRFVDSGAPLMAK
ncbi:MAG TPA: response regulator [Opitutaceae bacterium]|nr:response regulator [Opitutaceae bacterium]